jgi:hypothetical protein
VRQPPNIGRAVKEALAHDAQGEVIAAFSRASYVDVGGHVFALLSISECSGPLHARVADPPLVRLGDRVEVTAGRLFIEGKLVDLPSACWEPEPLPIGVPIAELLGVVLMHEPVLDLGSGATGSLQGSLNFAFASGGLSEACRGIFGRGSGLTPAGDDVAAGLLFADALLGLSEEESRLAIAADAPTHEISRAFLTWAARGRSIEPLHRLLAACASGNLDAARSARADLAAIGHTSGLDLAYGVLIGLGRDAGGLAGDRPDRPMTSRAITQITA